MIKKASVILILIFALYRPVPCAAQPKQEINKNIESLKINSGTNQKSPASSPVITSPSLQVCANQAHQNSNNETASTNWWTAGLTGGLLIVATIQAFLFFRQLKIMRKSIAIATEEAKAARESADIAHRSLVATLRPKIIVRRVSFDVGDPPGAGIRRVNKIQYIIANVGGSTGKIVEHNRDIGLFDDFPIIQPLTTEADKIPIPFRPGESFPFALIVDNKPEVIDAFIWDDRDDRDDKRQITFFGYIMYQDDLGIVRRTQFRRIFDPVTKRFFKPRNTDDEYED